MNNFSNVRRFKYPIYQFYLILFLSFLFSCKKVIVEKVEFVDKSNIIIQKYYQDAKYSIYSGLVFKKKISEIRDTSIIKSCDLNFDGIFDVNFGYELKNKNKKDSLILVSFFEKINSDFEFIYDEFNDEVYLTPYYDTNNYIGPSSILWKYQNAKVKYKLSWNLLEECVVNNNPQLCIRSYLGLFIPPNQSFDGIYYQGFRFKNKLNKNQWNYGYIAISYSALNFEIRAIAHESYPDMPIGLRKVF